MTSPNNWQRKLQGFAPMSAKSMKVLDYLFEAKSNDWPFVPLPGVHKHTLAALFIADLIAQSLGDDGTRYKITERGERTRQAYTQHPHRNDGLCPDCCIRLRHVTRSGRVEGYCLPCSNKAKRRAYKLKRPHHCSNRFCSRCHKRPVHVSSGGVVLTYCKPCKNLRNRRVMQQIRKRRAKKAQAKR